MAKVNRACIACDVERTIDDEIGHWICPECGYWNEIYSKRIQRAMEAEEKRKQEGKN